MRTVAYFGDHLSFSTLVPEDEGRIEGEQNFPKFLLLPPSHSFFPRWKRELSGRPRRRRRSPPFFPSPSNSPFEMSFPSPHLFPFPHFLSSSSIKRRLFSSSPPFRKRGNRGVVLSFSFSPPFPPPLPPPRLLRRGDLPIQTPEGGKRVQKAFDGRTRCPICGSQRIPHLIYFLSNMVVEFPVDAVVIY